MGGGSKRVGSNILTIFFIFAPHNGSDNFYNFYIL